MNKLDTRVQIAVIILGNTLNSKYINNQNIFISGMTNEENQTIRWEITKL